MGGAGSDTFQWWLWKGMLQLSVKTCCGLSAVVSGMALGTVFVSWL